jgi:predicted HicB family RNase H-like nuclease
MMNTISINGYRAIIQYDPDIELFRGEFIDLNGGADFYAKDVEQLKKEGALSLDVFLTMCKEENIEPKKTYSGRFNLRLPNQLHADIAAKASATGKSINQWITDVLSAQTAAHS